jgi:cytidylate kinase
MKRLCVTASEAERLTRVEDDRRRQWVQDLLNTDSHDPSHYDVVLSTGQFSVDQAAALIVRSYRAMQGDKRGLPVKMLKASPAQTPVFASQPLWMKAGK